MHISRLYFPVILDGFIPPPSFRSYCIDVSNYSPREPSNSRARECHIRRVRGTHHKSALRGILALASRYSTWKQERTISARPTIAATVTTAPKLVKLPAHAKRGALADNKIPTARRVVAVRTGDSISIAAVNLALASAGERKLSRGEIRIRTPNNRHQIVDQNQTQDVYRVNKCGDR